MAPRGTLSLTAPHYSKAAAELARFAGSDSPRSRFAFIRRRLREPRGAMAPGLSVFSLRWAVQQMRQVAIPKLPVRRDGWSEVKPKESRNPLLRLVLAEELVRDDDASSGIRLA